MKRKRERVKTAHVTWAMFDFSFGVVTGPAGDQRVVKLISGMTNISERAIMDDFVDAQRAQIWHCAEGTAIWLPRVPRTAADYASLTHEVFHALCYMARHVDLPLSRESEEAYAYALGFAVREVILQLKK